MKLNGCHNHEPFVDTVLVRSGWDEAGVSRVIVEIPNVMTKDCQYSILTPDPRCAGCKWSKQP